MLCLNKMYAEQAINGDLSCAVEFPAEFSERKSEFMDKAEELLGEELFNNLMDYMANEEDAYRERAYKQGFKDGVNIILESMTSR